MKQLRALQIFGIITSIGAYFMLAIGAIVSATESGKGCGNTWPFCHGKLIPESLPMETVIEYSHRIVSGVDGLLILILTVWSWMAFKENKRVKVLGFLSLFFVVFQGVLGALTVVFEGTFAKNFSLALHFGFSLISFASVILLTVYLFQLSNPEKKNGLMDMRNTPLAKWLWGLAAYTYIVVYTGALVRHSEATMGCGYSFPLCGPTVFPGFSSLAEIHLLHRYFAFLLFFLVLGTLIFILKKHRDRKDLVRGGWLAFLLITLQALSGAIIVWTGGKLMAELLHTTIISGFFAVLSYMCMQIGLPWSKKTHLPDVSTEVGQTS
ncbi:heme A synthase [Thermoactinomyces intermedius]|jgi:heme a synthase|uniref:Heme A synthase n=1 Tax=Thermoactinomyces intermedius TaxID=2024 RepID=A0A8I1DDY4_THEIN|nr:MULTISPECIES: heme A synthase [Thermoactinomyces]MBA4548494.1 heme A synthase [Thermoactinomyces intermedius]MBA4835866.1 heme A synthase [Thermoactinomyces intermedius]MBH8594372.1 heme A synthase [Thermoactinomyces intermedius]MBH8601723.1 heme A synthase [Thermoactinomyces sp. CICC 23799]